MIQEKPKKGRVYKRGERNQLSPGTVFGRLTVVKYSHSVSYGHSKQKNASTKFHYLCTCLCGNSSTVDKQSLLTGKTVSCGCKRLEGRVGTRKRNPAYTLWYGAKVRAKHAGLEFSLELEDIQIPEVCPVLGLDLVSGSVNGSGGPKPNSPSLDRLDNSKGYTKANIWVISFKANAMKNNYSLEELRALVNALDLKLGKTDVNVIP